jgi:hypothetical protein
MTEGTESLMLEQLRAALNLAEGSPTMQCVLVHEARLETRPIAPILAGGKR